MAKGYKDISKIFESPDDRADFNKRLAVLDLDEQALIGSELVVEDCRSLNLKMTQATDIPPRILQTSDLDKVRDWVGTPIKAAACLNVAPSKRDNLARQRRTSKKALSAKSSSSEAANAGEFERATGVCPNALLHKIKKYSEANPAEKRKHRPTSSELDVLRSAARAYIKGDMLQTKAYKPAIEAYFGNFQIAAWLFATVRVKKNSTLYFGPGTHNLTAYQVIIEDGGKIVSHGHLRVSATRLRRSSGGGIVKLPDHVLTDTLPEPIFP